jgi:hypothetical protein
MKAIEVAVIAFKVSFIRVKSSMIRLREEDIARHADS